MKYMCIYIWKIIWTGTQKTSYGCNIAIAYNTTVVLNAEKPLRYHVVIFRFCFFSFSRFFDRVDWPNYYKEDDSAVYTTRGRDPGRRERAPRRRRVIIITYNTVWKILIIINNICVMLCATTRICNYSPDEDEKTVGRSLALRCKTPWCECGGGGVEFARLAAWNRRRRVVAGSSAPRLLDLSPRSSFDDFIWLVFFSLSLAPE